MQISVIPHARRFAAALAIPVGATLVFASTALAWGHSLELKGNCVSGSEATLTVTANDESEKFYSEHKTGELRIYKDGTAVGEQVWQWPANATPGTKAVIATIDVKGPGGSSVNGTWKVALLKEEADSGLEVKVNVGATATGTDKAKDDKAKDDNGKDDEDKDTEASEDDHDTELVSSNKITLNCVTPSPSPSLSPGPTPTPTPTGGSGGGQPGMPKTGHPAA